MLQLLLALLCFIAIGFIVLLLRSYELLTLAELKRQARAGNTEAKNVYGVRSSFGLGVYILMWTIIGILSIQMVLLLDSRLWGLIVVLIFVPATVVLYALLPRIRYPSPSLALASLSAPIVRRLLSLALPLFFIVRRIPTKWIERDETRKLHSKEELLEVLENTQINDDPFSKDELSIAMHALTFGDLKITQVMTPRSVVKTVRADDILSPVLLGELHQSGFSRFPVIEPERGDYVGVLYSKDLSDLRTNKYVRDAMKTELYYVNEFTSLDNVLNAFLRTQHHLFLVVNEFEEIVGIVTIEDVLEQIIGRKIVDEFDQYADLRVVARQIAQKEAKERPGVKV